MRTDVTRAFLALYDEMLAAYERHNRIDFSAIIARRCAEFRSEHPETSQALIGMMMHFSARDEALMRHNAEKSYRKEV